MSDQLDLFTGPQLRDAGTAVVYDNEPDAWKDAAWAALLVLADMGDPFTSEDLRAIVGDPERPNVVGSIFLRASKRGIIRQTGRNRRATRPSLHATVLPEWVGA